MEPEFQRILFRVALIGGAILVIGAGTLVVAFRAFDPVKSRGRDFRASLLVVAVLAFVMICCVALLMLSRVR